MKDELETFTHPYLLVFCSQIVCSVNGKCRERGYLQFSRACYLTVTLPHYNMELSSWFYSLLLRTLARSQLTAWSTCPKMRHGRRLERYRHLRHWKIIYYKHLIDGYWLEDFKAPNVDCIDLAVFEAFCEWKEKHPENYIIIIFLFLFWTNVISDASWVDHKKMIDQKRLIIWEF